MVIDYSPTQAEKALAQAGRLRVASSEPVGPDVRILAKRPDARFQSARELFNFIAH